MFDRVTLVPRPSIVHHHVTEKRAPTDESVRLLREMEAAAEAKVMASVKVGDTTFECVLHAFRDAPSGDRVNIAIFSLGGKKMRAEHRAPDYDASPQNYYDGIVRAIADKVATEIVRPALKSILR